MIDELPSSEHTARKLAFTIAKGGQLKTTSVVNVAGAILEDETLKSAKVCIIDLDPQANVWQTFGHNADRLEKGQDLSEAILKGNVSNCVFEIYKKDEKRYIHSITANENCDLLEMIIASKAKEFDNILGLLSAIVEKIEHKYDYILFDTAPAYSLLISNLLSVKDIEIYVPFEPDIFSVRSVLKSIKSFDVFNKTNPTAKFGGIFATKVKARTNTHQNALVQTKIFAEANNKKLLNTQIPSNVKNANAVLYDAVPSTLAKKKADVVMEYYKLWEEIK